MSPSAGCVHILARCINAVWTQWPRMLREKVCKKRKAHNNITALCTLFFSSTHDALIENSGFFFMSFSKQLRLLSFSLALLIQNLFYHFNIFCFLFLCFNWTLITCSGQHSRNAQPRRRAPLRHSGWKDAHTTQSSRVSWMLYYPLFFRAHHPAVSFPLLSVESRPVEGVHIAIGELIFDMNFLLSQIR